MKSHKYLILILFISLLVSCKKDDAVVSTQVAASTMMDVSYGTDAAQKMDVYLPANRSVTTTKLMILIHGGSWVGGDKTDFLAFVRSIKQHQAVLTREKHAWVCCSQLFFILILLT